jgi:hypothetical protein
VPIEDSWVPPDGRMLAVGNSLQVLSRSTPPAWIQSVIEVSGSSVRTLWSAHSTFEEAFKLYGIWARSPADIYAVGSAGEILKLDGSDAIRMESGTARNLFGVGGAGDAVFVVGEGGTILRLVGDRWVASESGTTATLRAVWGSSASNVYAVGDGGTILRFDGRRWSSMSSGTRLRLNSVWGTADGTVFGAGEAGVILVGK